MRSSGRRDYRFAGVQCGQTDFANLLKIKVSKVSHNAIFKNSPFQERLNDLNLVTDWTSWNGYKSARTFDTLASEYFAIRSTCSLMDLTPMEKYRVRGPDAESFLNRLVTRDISKLEIDKVTYVIWCNDEGKVLDDGTLFRLSDNDYRLLSLIHISEPTRR